MSWWVMIENRNKPETGPITKYSLALNYVPVIYIVIGAFVVFEAQGFGFKVFACLGWIYLLPPIMCRLVTLVWGAPSGKKLTQEDQPYKVWWFISQMQMVLNRLHFLEEILRLFPGLYALWLRLWGAHVSPFSFWAPGVKVLDRNLLNVGPGVVIGSQALISSHLASVDETGAFRIDIATVEIQSGASIGAKSGIAPGCIVYSNQQLPAGRLMKPYTTWPRGKGGADE